MLNATALAAQRMEILDWRHKAVPSSGHGLNLAAWLARSPRLSQLETPLMTLDAQALDHNIAEMAHWCAKAGLVHAPHGKPTMAPQLWQRQLAAGAWGITIANAPQLRVARAFGVPTVMVANEMVTPTVVSWLADWVSQGARVVCFVDSVAAVAMMDDALRGTESPLEVCVELGGRGGRCGARDAETAQEVAAAVRATRGLRLVGVAGYEGSLAHDTTPESIATVDSFLIALAQLHSAMRYETDEPIVSAGGSEYFDQVADRLGPLARTGARVVLRAGSYITHDDGLYARTTPAARGLGGPQLRAALRCHATVLSVPEAGKAIVDAGRRDLPFDAGYPIPLDLPGVIVSELNDQHTHLSGEVSSLRVGDVVRLGISHPCTTFDKWSLIPVLDGQDVVVDAIRTYF